MIEQNPFIEEVALDDHELVAQIRAGSRAALETLIKRHQSWIYNIVQRMVYLPQDAEDITQEILIKMMTQFGLINRANPCRCAKKTRGFMNAGYVNPENLLFAREHITRVREVARKTCDDMESLDAAYAEVHRDHPFLEPPDFVASVRNLLNSPDFKSILDPH